MHLNQTVIINRLQFNMSLKMIWYLLKLRLYIKIKKDKSKFISINAY